MAQRCGTSFLVKFLPGYSEGR